MDMTHPNSQRVYGTAQFQRKFLPYANLLLFFLGVVPEDQMSLLRGCKPIQTLIKTN